MTQENCKCSSSAVCWCNGKGAGKHNEVQRARRPHTPSAVPTYLHLRTNGRVRQQTYHSSGTFAATGVVVGGRGFFAHRPTHPRPGSATGSPLSALRLQHTAFRFRSSCVRVYTRSGHGWRRRPAPRLRYRPGAAARPRGGVVPAPRDRAGNPRGPGKGHPVWPATGRHATVPGYRSAVAGLVCMRQRGVVICDVSIYTKVRRSRL